MAIGTDNNGGAKPRIGFIGVGFMGHGMTANLLRKVDLTVEAAKP